jgi:outer membrane immunogenic protein
MKRGALAALAVLAMPLNARAADVSPIPYKAQVAPSFYDWTGFYVGMNGGGTWLDGTSGFVFRDGTTFGIPGASLRGTGAIGGVQGGYNYQIGRLLLGTEVDLSWSNASASSTVTGVETNGNGYNFSRSENLSWLDTMRLRLGYVPFDRALLYATGGVAYGQVTSTSNLALSTGVDYSGSLSGARTGWTAGGGIAYALTDRWSARLEYLCFHPPKARQPWSIPSPQDVHR